MEMFVWLIAPMILLVMIAVYFYRSVLRRIQYFFHKNDSRKNKLGAVGITIAFFAPALSLYGMWSIVIFYMVGMMLLCDVIVFAIHKIFRNRSWRPVIRGLHYSGLAVVFATCAVMTYGYYNMRHVVRTEYHVSTSKSIRNQGYKVALIADLHFGISLTEDELSKYAEQISDEHPDIVVLGGDIMDERTTYEEMKDAIAILSEIQSTYGTYYVYGNHDKNQYSREKNYTKLQLDEELHRAGIRILENENVSIEDDLTIVGRSDYSDVDVQRVGLDSLLEHVDQDHEILIVDHQPKDYKEAKRAGVDIIVSGHTHAGQIWPAGLLDSIFHFNEKNYGCEVDGNLQKIVTSGIAGWGYPVRTERHSEYVMIHISKNVKETY